MNFYPFNHKNVVLVNNNKAVLKTSYHLCGYVALPISVVPPEWQGDYNADALQYLNIHGGITFCSVYSDNDSYATLLKEYQANVSDYREKNKDLQWLDRRAGEDEIEQKFYKQVAELTDAYVVFGFDCGHCDDEHNDLLKDPNHVMKLVEEMEVLITTYAKVINEWRTATAEEKVDMLESINRFVSSNNNLGFGAIIDMMGGASKLK